MIKKRHNQKEVPTPEAEMEKELNWQSGTCTYQVHVLIRYMYLSSKYQVKADIYSFKSSCFITYPGTGDGEMHYENMPMP